MTPADLRAFARRDWDLLAENKAAFWRDEAGMTPTERLRIAEQLYEFARQTHPTWPSEADRAEDLAAHHRLAELLSRAKLP